MTSHVDLRKKINLTLQKVLKKNFHKEQSTIPIDVATIQKILLVRINYRIGNILFTTPLLNALAKQFPNAKIDVMIGAPFIVPLIQDMPHINKVYSFDRKLLKHPLKILNLRKEMNGNNYDLMILPSGLSSSDTLISWFINAHYKIGFYDKDSFKPLTHTLESPDDLQHEALAPLRLMRLLGAKDESDFDHSLDIKLSDTEKENVRGSIVPRSIGIFRDARNEKQIEISWWAALIDTLEELDPDIQIIDILDPNNTVAINGKVSTLSEKNLRILAAKIANLDAFICGDTGPMHLASASLTPTIALFKTTSPDLYGTLGQNDFSIVLKDKDVNKVGNMIYEHILKLDKDNNEIKFQKR